MRCLSFFRSWNHCDLSIWIPAQLRVWISISFRGFLFVDFVLWISFCVLWIRRAQHTSMAFLQRQGPAIAAGLLTAGGLVFFGADIFWSKVDEKMDDCKPVLEVSTKFTIEEMSCTKNMKKTKQKDRESMLLWHWTHQTSPNAELNWMPKPKKSARNAKLCTVNWIREFQMQIVTL